MAAPALHPAATRPAAAGSGRLGAAASASPAAPGPSSREAGLSTDAQLAMALRPRLALGVAFVAAVMALQLTSDWVGGRETARILARFVYMACELPLLMLALTAAFRRTVHRGLSATQALAVGAGIATTFGLVFGFIYGQVVLRMPELRAHFPSGVSLVRMSLFGALNSQMYFGLWSLAFIYPLAVESARTRSAETAQLRSEAELARLRAHLEPHFLLNTLNAIAGLVVEEPREARRLVSCLGDLLRDAVQDTGAPQSLERQFAWLQRYAKILEARHRGSLTFEWRVPADCLQVELPSMLLQPLVENAVQHGALRRTDGGGRVVVSAEVNDAGRLVCLVEDNGPGMPEHDVRAGAFGLHAVRRRLALEAPGATLRHESSAAGTRCIVELGRLREAT